MPFPPSNMHHTDAESRASQFKLHCLRWLTSGCYFHASIPVDNRKGRCGAVGGPKNQGCYPIKNNQVEKNSLNKAKMPLSMWPKTMCIPQRTSSNWHVSITHDNSGDVSPNYLCKLKTQLLVQMSFPLPLFQTRTLPTSYGKFVEQDTQEPTLKAKFTAV